MVSSNVSVSDVRTALNEIDTSQIPDSTISQAIGFAEANIDKDDVSNTAEDDDVDTAVTMYAAYRAFTASPPQTQKEAFDASASWDMKTYIEELKLRRKEAMENIGVTEGGTTAPFADSASPVFHDRNDLGNSY